LVRIGFQIGFCLHGWGRGGHAHWHPEYGVSKACALHRVSEEAFFVAPRALMRRRAACPGLVQPGLRRDR